MIHYTIIRTYWHEWSALQSVNVPSSSTLLPKGVLESKFIKQKFTGMPEILWIDPFPDPICHFQAPWQPFWIFEVLIEGSE